ncbi:MAG: DUF2461 domain-containing protein [Ignavibacteriales bacterium]|nr:DUF2461 domain-containing protein [Ignavibacteriales bacterium]
MKPPPLDLELYPPFETFPKEGIQFLSQLKKNNNREWFAKHKAEYEEFVKFPMLSLIATIKPKLETVAPEMEADPKKSMFRIYRDTRFSKDKTPYKTHVAAVFHPRGHWQNSAGYYLHIEQKAIYVGGGIYMPNSEQLKKIRKAIADNGKEFLSIVNNKTFIKNFKKIEGEKLQRVPVGYSAEHPMAEWLKHKQLYTGVTWKMDECYSKKFLDKVIVVYKELLPFIRFLNEALEK